MVSLFSLINYSYSSFLELCHHFSMSLFMFTCQLRPKRIFPQHAFRFFGYDHPWQWLAENCATSDIFVGIDWVTPISKNMNSKFFQYITFECVQILYQSPTERHAITVYPPFTSPYFNGLKSRIRASHFSLFARDASRSHCSKTGEKSWYVLVKHGKHGWLQLTLQNMGHPEFNKWWHPWVV